MNTNKNQKTFFFVNLLLLVSFLLLARASHAMAEEDNALRYALIEQTTGKVVNVILLDPSSKWVAPAGDVIVRSDTAGPGDVWNGSDFIKVLSQKQEISSALQATGNDVAELMQSKENALPGNLVAVSEEGLILRKTDKPYDRNMIGVISTDPGFVLGNAEGGISLPVALSGRVRVRVSTENGPVAPGDAITSSSVAGIGMKATQPGRVIGIALESWKETAVAGPIMVLINPQWIGNDLSVVETSSGQLSNIDPAQLKAGLADLGLVVNTRGILEVDTLIARKVRTQRIEMVDQRNGDLYCTWIDNGQLTTVRGQCDTIQIDTAPQASPPPATFDTTITSTTDTTSPTDSTVLSATNTTSPSDSTIVSTTNTTTPTQ